jgi:hypothetical protein
VAIQTMPSNMLKAKLLTFDWIKHTPMQSKIHSQSFSEWWQI